MPRDHSETSFVCLRPSIQLSHPLRDLGVLWNRVLFEEACTSIIDAVQHMPRLRTLHLEPIAEDSLVPEVLFTLGKDIQELCILGESPLSPYSSSHLPCRAFLRPEGLLSAPAELCVCPFSVSHCTMR